MYSCITCIANIKQKYKETTAEKRKDQNLNKGSENVEGKNVRNI